MSGRPDSLAACRPHDWQIAREGPVGTFRVFACGYWRDPFVVVVMGRVIIGKRALRRRWQAVAS